MRPVVPMFSALQDLSQQLVVKSTFLDVTDGLSALVNKERLLIMFIILSYVDHRRSTFVHAETAIHSRNTWQLFRSPVFSFAEMQ